MAKRRESGVQPEIKEVEEGEGLEDSQMDVQDKKWVSYHYDGDDLVSSEEESVEDTEPGCNGCEQWYEMMATIKDIVGGKLSATRKVQRIQDLLKYLKM